jgi:hypothetical protein
LASQCPHDRGKIEPQVAPDSRDFVFDQWKMVTVFDLAIETSSEPVGKPDRRQIAESSRLTEAWQQKLFPHRSSYHAHPTPVARAYHNEKIPG